MSPKIRICLVVLVTSCLTAIAFFQTTDQIGQTHVDSAFKRALLAFAIARGLNGVISVAQGTEIALQPAGVGVNFTPGQILDPINDLIERFSWIMMLASSSLGIQKVLLSMSAWQGLLLAMVLCAVLVVCAHIFRQLAPWRQVLQRLFLFVLILRFMMPAISIANDWVYRAFLEADYQEASATLDKARQTIGEINDRVLPAESETGEQDGIIDRARRAYQIAIDQVDIDKRLTEYREAAESISENTIKLVVVFIMQTVVFPLVFLFIVFGVLRRITRV
ncbi:MAG: hypothetical protein AB8B87_06675 [Granulosicoccus sp.]